MADIPRYLKESIDSTKVEYRRLGKSGLQISVPILGAMSFGSPEWQPWIIEEDKALPLLKAAYDRGLNTVCMRRWVMELYLRLIGCTVGHCEYVFQWQVGADHRKCTQEVRYPTTQSGYHEQMLPDCQ